MTQGRFRAAIQEGALALEHGWDPLRYLDLTGVDLLAARKVLQAAIDRTAEKDKQYWKNMQAAVANGVAKAFGG